MTETKTLTWSEAIDQAFEPTDLERALDKHRIPFTSPIIGEDGKVTGAHRIREKAAHAYLRAHAGEHAVVEYVDPDSDDETGGRWIHRAEGTLEPNFVAYTQWVGDGQAKKVEGFVVGRDVIPLAGVSSIRVVGDNSVVVL